MNKVGGAVVSCWKKPLDPGETRLAVRLLQGPGFAWAMTVMLLVSSSPPFLILLLRNEKQSQDACLSLTDADQWTLPTLGIFLVFLLRVPMYAFRVRNPVLDLPSVLKLPVSRGFCLSRFEVLSFSQSLLVSLDEIEKYLSIDCRACWKKGTEFSGTLGLNCCFCSSSE